VLEVQFATSSCSHTLLVSQDAAVFLGEPQTVGLELVGREELMKKMQRKTDELIISYEGEWKKRSKFQYDIGVQAKRGYAQTSLEHARTFVFEINKLVNS
jgi:hypothetical protein